jgi:hypothetical protein
MMNGEEGLRRNRFMSESIVPAGSAVLLGLVCLGSALAPDRASSAEPGEAPSFIEYRCHGADSPYQEVSITIAGTGGARVVTRRHVGPGVDYKTQLSREELGALKTLVHSTDFFAQPEKDGTGARDVGATELTVRSGDDTRTLSFHYRPSMQPLTEVLWKLVAQAEAVRAIEGDGDIYTASAVVNPRQAGMKALQPDRLKEPLMAYVCAHTDRQKVEWALEGLAFVTTPEEFSGFVALRLEDAKQRDLFLGLVGTHPFWGNIPESHLKALCPVYLAFARDARARTHALEKAEQQALGDFTRLLGDIRYQPAIPVLTKWFEQHREPYVDASLTPLARMGTSSLTVLVPYLQSSEECYRVNAIELLVLASRTSPRAGFSNPLSEYEFGQMIPVFTNTVIPKLVTLAGQDPSAKVKATAGKAVEEIGRRVRE